MDQTKLLLISDGMYEEPKKFVQRIRHSPKINQIIFTPEGAEQPGNGTIRHGLRNDGLVSIIDSIYGPSSWL